VHALGSKWLTDELNPSKHQTKSPILFLTKNQSHVQPPIIDERVQQMRL